EATLTTLGADKAYHQKKFVAGCRERAVAPHPACKDRIEVPRLDGRTTGRAGSYTAAGPCMTWAPWAGVVFTQPASTTAAKSSARLSRQAVPGTPFCTAVG